MRIKFKGSEAVEIADTGDLVEPGDVVEVDDALGASLCEQVDKWEPAPSKAAKADSKES